MPQNVKFEQIMVNRMVIKMCCNRIRCHIVCGMLYRCERIDLLPHWQHDNPARMLSRGAPHAHAAFHNTVDLAGPFVFSALFIIVLHIAESSLVRQRTDRPGAKGLAISKDNLRIFVCLTLIFARKIQINIGLFVSFKTQKTSRMVCQNRP